MGRSLALLAIGLALPLSSTAVPLTYQTSLSGDAESPPVPSAGTGFATVTIDTDANTLAVDVSFSGLTGTTTVAHIHCCTLPTAGVATTTPTFPGFPAGVMAGTYSEVFDLSDPASFNPAFVTANGDLASAVAALAGGLSDGVAYLNIHSSFATGGEIRGFLVLIPEPSTAVLVGGGALVLALARRREKARRG